MRASDTKTLAYQSKQKIFNNRGYVHLSEPCDFDNDEPRKKKKMNLMPYKYCKLSKSQMLELRNYLMPHIKSLKSTLAEVFSKAPVELISDSDGIVMTEMTFRRLYSKFKNEVMNAEDIKKKVLKLKDTGLSADEICEKLRNVARPQYLRQILEECGFGSQKSKTEIIRELLAQGLSYAQINKQRPDISIKYARDIDALEKKKDYKNEGK